MSLATYIFRKGCLRSDNRRDAGLTVPDNIQYIPDLLYGTDRQWQTLDICYPKDRPSAATIVNVHGGGYVYGTTRTYKFYCCDLASRGYTVVSFNYRLAPKHIFPTPLVDLNLVMEWLCAHQNDYPLDMNNIFMVGDSAGAQLVSQYAALYSNSEYAELMGICPPEFRLAAVGLNCGMYDIAALCRSTERINMILRSYFTRRPERFGDKLDVMKHITPTFPPAYLLSAHGDYLLEHCRPMAEHLASLGVPCEYKIYCDSSTGHVFHVDFRTQTAQQANSEELEFMSRYIMPRSEKNKPENMG